MRLLSFQVLLWSLLCLPGWAEDLSDAAQAQIDGAERELLLAETSLQRGERRLAELMEDPTVSDEQVLLMEEYVVELGNLVEIRRKTYTDLLAMAGEAGPSPDPSVTEGMEAFEASVGEVPSAEEPETEQERLDREFAASLEEFDGLILEYNRELEDKIAARSAKGEAQASSRQTAASEAEDLLRSMGVDPGTGEGEGQETGEVAEGPTGTDAEGAEGTSPEVASNSGASGNSSAQPGSSRPPREDEDVVARQLREAAEKETDPVLREKLWKEYEAYLDGRS